MGNGQTSNVVRFGVFEADLRTGELRKAGLRLRLQEQPFRILAALLERPGELVTRDELRQRIWPKESFGDFDHAIDLAVGKLRTALGDSAGVPRFVETLPRRGYRFLAPTSTEALSETAHPDSVPTDLTQARRQWGKSITAWRIVAAIAVALLPFLGIAAFRARDNGHALRPGLVLVGAFENATGEPVLDGTLQFALERELANSQFARVVSSERVQDILKLMRRPPDTRLDRALSLDICRRTPDIGVLVMGRVAKIGSQYFLTVDVVDPASGSVLRAAGEQASRQDDVLAALHRLSRQVRRDIGESIAAPLFSPEPVTTSSLHAVQLYSEANDLMIRRGPKGEDIIALLEQALAEDPDFASAHVLLGYALGNTGLEGADPHFERAFSLANTTSERERLFILATYYGRKAARPGDSAWMKATAAYEQLVRHYPDDHWGLNNLSHFYEEVGRTREALQLRAREVELRPENEDVLIGDLWARLILFGEQATADRLAASCDREPAFGPCLGLFPQRDALPIWRELRQGHPEEALRLADQLVRKYSRLEPRTVYELNSVLSNLYKGAGMLRADADLAASIPGADWQGEEPVLIAELREDRSALSAALTRALRRQDVDVVGSFTVMLLAKVGRVHEARAMLARVEKTQPPDVVQVARGYFKLAEGDFLGSIPNLRAGAASFGQRRVAPFIIACDRLAAALESLGQVEEAVQTLADCENQLAGWSDWEYVTPWNSVARWHLATLYRRTGKVTEAEAIEDALRGQLKLADPDHPIARALKQLPPSNYQAAVRN